MKIYTKTGDNGETGLYGGKRVPKSELRIEAYGTVDELNSVIGVVLTETQNSEYSFLKDIQQDLFKIGADLSAPYSEKNKNVERLKEHRWMELEKEIDRYELQLETLKNFILPGGSKQAAYLHLARTVCRRAERRVVQLSFSEEVNKNIVIYLNRLSDLFFVMARFENKVANMPDVIWDQLKRKN